MLRQHERDRRVPHGDRLDDMTAFGKTRAAAAASGGHREIQHSGRVEKVERLVGKGRVAIVFAGARGERADDLVERRTSCCLGPGSHNHPHQSVPFPVLAVKRRTTSDV